MHSSNDSLPEDLTQPARKTSAAGLCFGTYLVEESVGYLLARARTKLAKTLDMALAEFGITNAQGSTLLMLMTGKYSTAAELARELYIDAAAMTRMIDRLEKRELIQRERTRDDRRIVRLALTESGRELGQRLPALYSDVVKRSFSRFSSDELDSLRALLRKSLENDDGSCPESSSSLACPDVAGSGASASAPSST